MGVILSNNFLTKLLQQEALERSAVIAAHRLSSIWYVHGNLCLNVKMARTRFGTGFSAAKKKVTGVKSRYNSRKILSAFLKNSDNPADLVKRYSPIFYLAPFCGQHIVGNL